MSELLSERGPAIGFLETSSIAKGIEATDAMMKKAAVDLLMTTIVPRGKYLVMVGGNVADVESSLRAGLETADIALCQAVVTLPIDPRFRSLNLAQAVAINAYEWRMTVESGAPPIFREGPPPAEAAAMLGLYEHFERELDDAGFFHPPEKKPSMMQNLRSAL